MICAPAPEKMPISESQSKRTSNVRVTFDEKEDLSIEISGLLDHSQCGT
jgi:hypothetical protein